jgi:hypothetical protein
MQDVERDGRLSMEAILRRQSTVNVLRPAHDAHAAYAAIRQLKKPTGNV